jgi:hypothetical protein
MSDGVKCIDVNCVVCGENQGILYGEITGSDKNYCDGKCVKCLGRIENYMTEYTCKDCYKIFKKEIPMLYCDSCKGIIYETNEWIQFDDQMPKLNQEIEIKFNDEQIEKAIFKANRFKEYFVIEYDSETGIKYANLNRCNYWRPIKEKRPDFKKIKYGDLKMYF